MTFFPLSRSDPPRLLVMSPVGELHGLWVRATYDEIAIRVCGQDAAVAWASLPALSLACCGVDGPPLGTGGVSYRLPLRLSDHPEVAAELTVGRAAGALEVAIVRRWIPEIDDLDPFTDLTRTPGVGAMGCGIFDVHRVGDVEDVDDRAVVLRTSVPAGLLRQLAFDLNLIVRTTDA